MRKPHRSKSPRGGAGALLIVPSSPPAELFFLHHDNCGNQDHLDDPMLEEAVINYSPDGGPEQQESPVYAPTAEGLAVLQSDVNASASDLIASLATPRFKQPLTPRSLKMIADLVEKGGCKKLKIKVAKGRAVSDSSLESNVCKTWRAPT
ncbi:uncharacterized protein LOC127772261 [Oryza glaberrima]|uniref:uncharacterized protein LOC127772261 n=1 Tax=Oryza glaberrima TaxID=4538 RepID=UPI00224C1720|nr:uncharacterized protein LOC127772261 [Oryza glaberrima]